jgi:hypothetical protein
MIRMFMRRARGFIVNFIRWLPFLWNDTDDDYGQFYFMLYNKFRFMEAFFRKIGYSKKAKSLMVAKNLALRLYKPDYIENALYWHNQIYKPRQWDECWEKTEDGCMKYVTDPDKNRRESLLRCYNHSDYMESQDLEYLLNHINKHLRRWWY